MKKRIIIMAVCLLVLIGAVIGVSIHNKQKAAAEGEESSESFIYSTLIDVDVNNIASIFVTYDGDSYTLIPGETTVTGINWSMKEHPEWTLSYSSMSIVNLGTKFNTYKLIEENVTDPDRLAEFGLKDPLVRLITTMKDGSLYEVHVGTRSSDHSYAFCQVVGDNNVYACDGNNYTYLTAKAKGMRQVTIQSSMDSEGFPCELFIQGKGGLPIDIYYDDQYAADMTEAGVALASGFRFREPYHNDVLAVRTDLQKGYFATLAMPEVIEVIDADCQNLDQYGLGDEPEYHEIITTRKGTADNYVYNTTDYVFGFRYGENNEYVYFREGNSNIVFGVDASCLSARSSTPFDFVNKLMFIRSIKMVDHGTLTIDGETYTFRALRQELDESAGITEDNRLEVYYFNEQLVESDPFLNLYRMMISVSPAYEMLEEPAYDKNDVVTFTLYMTDGTENTVTYYRMSEFYYVAQIDEDHWFAVSTNCFDDIRTSLEALKKAME